MASSVKVKNVLKVPVSAVFPLPVADAHPDGAMAVYVIEKEHARLRLVRPGARNDREAWVLDGLVKGTRVVVYPATEVRDAATQL